jgi:cytochrome c556
MLRKYRDISPRIPRLFFKSKQKVECFMSFSKYAVVVFTGLVMSGITFAAPEAAVKYRQATMGVIGGHMRALGAIAKGDVSHDDELAAHTQGIASMANFVKEVFKENATSNKSKAKPEIWTKPAEFSAKADDFKKAADSLAQIVSTGDKAAIAKQVGALGKTCKGCHDAFEQKD